MRATRPVHVAAMKYQVTLLDDDDVNQIAWSITVERRGSGEHWAVCWMSSCWDFEAGEWVYEPIPSERDKDFLKATRRDYEGAMEVAERLIHTLKVNGMTSYDVMARDRAYD